MMKQFLDLISVIIPYYNSYDTIFYTVRSVLSQSYTNFEIIIVDDGSEISPTSILNSFHDSRLKYFKIDHGNANIARNFGIMQAKGNFIAMLDSDDIWLKNHLSDCLNNICIKNADGLYSGVYFIHKIEDPINSSHSCKGRPLKEGESMADYLLTVGFLLQHCL